MRIIAFVLFFLPACVFSVSKEAMLRDFEIIKNTYEVRYAPGEWKKQHLDWELEPFAEKAILAIKEMKKPDVKEYQHIVSLFLQSMRDIHVKPQFYSTESSSLPFSLRTAEGRFFVASVDKKMNSLCIGDEVLAFDDIPIAECFDEIMRWKNYDFDSATDRALAARYLTQTFAAQDCIVKKGKVKVMLTRGEVELEWNYKPERITNGSWPEYSDLSCPDMCDPDYDKWPFMGTRRSFVPLLGEMLWESEQNAFFYAYLFEAGDGRKVGYLRIPFFVPSSDGAKEVEEFAKLITYFEDHSEALIIDVVDNPGGKAVFMYALLAMLTDKPLSLPKFQHTLTQQQIAQALEKIDELKDVQSDAEAQNALGSTLRGYPVTAKLAQSLVRHCQFLVSEWNLGKQISDFDFPMGLSELPPNRFVRYTKPLVVLTNELSVSCADFFPAILQDNGRAIIFGARQPAPEGLSPIFPTPTASALPPTPARPISPSE